MYQLPEETLPYTELNPEDAHEHPALDVVSGHLDFVPDDPAELRRAVTRMAGHINHADWRFIKLIAAMDRTRGWDERGYCNLGNWLDHRCGLGPCAARERIRIGRALARLPNIDAAFRDGILSYCDAHLAEFIQDAHGNLLNYERRRRIVPARLMRALKLRDHDRCRFPGCPHQRYVEAHHIQHWIDGGETRLDNLVLLCSAHHRLLHHGAFHIAVEDGDVVFVS